MAPGGKSRGGHNLMSERESKAKDIISSEYVEKPVSARVGDVLRDLRKAGHPPRSLSYVFVVAEDTHMLEGIADLRDLVLSPDDATLGDIMISPVVAAQESDIRDDVEKMFGVRVLDDSRRRQSAPPVGRDSLQRRHEGPGVEHMMTDHRRTVARANAAWGEGAPRAKRARRGAGGPANQTTTGAGGPAE